MLNEKLGLSSVMKNNRVTRWIWLLNAIYDLLWFAIISNQTGKMEFVEFFLSIAIDSIVNF